MSSLPIQGHFIACLTAAEIQMVWTASNFFFPALPSEHGTWSELLEIRKRSETVIECRIFTGNTETKQMVWTASISLRVDRLGSDASSPTWKKDFRKVCFL